MRIITDIGHPKDINVFKNVIYLLKEHGHEVKIVGRDKENIKKILAEYGFQCEFGPYYKSIIGKTIGVIHNDLWLYHIAKEFQPDIFISPGSPYSAHVSLLFRKPHLAYIDTEIATPAIKLMLPFTNRVYTSSSFYIDIGPKQERFNGYYELAYLHPKYFKPNEEIIRKYGLNEYIIMRLSALGAHHDLNSSGFSFKDEEELGYYINKLGKYGRVIISSEKEYSPFVAKYRLNFDPKDLHDILYFAKLYIGEGASMASEAAVLGVPSIYVSNTQRGYLNELEDKYGLAYSIPEKNIALKKATEILDNFNSKNEWKLKRDKMLKEKVDVVDFIVKSIQSFEHIADKC